MLADQPHTSRMSLVGRRKQKLYVPELDFFCPWVDVPLSQVRGRRDVLYAVTDPNLVSEKWQRVRGHLSSYTCCFPKWMESTSSGWKCFVLFIITTASFLASLSLSHLSLFFQRLAVATWFSLLWPKQMDLVSSSSFNCSTTSSSATCVFFLNRCE